MLNEIGDLDVTDETNATSCRTKSPVRCIHRLLHPEETGYTTFPKPSSIIIASRNTQAENRQA